MNLDNIYIQQTAMNEANTKEKDVFRDTPLRYLGYANEVGEAFRSLVPKTIVYASYAVASCYVVADASSKSYNSMKEKATGCTVTSPTVCFVDALVWQSLASVIIPGFVINRLCASTLFGLPKVLPKVPMQTRKWISTVIGLMAIPLIIHPIDRGVDLAMNKTLRNIYFSDKRKDR